MDLSDLHNKDLSLNASATSDDHRFLFQTTRPDRLLPKLSQDPLKLPKPLNPKKSPLKKPVKSKPKDPRPKPTYDKLIFQTLKRTNNFFQTVLESVYTYRPELANTLEKIYLTYNKLIEAVLESAKSIINNKEKEIEQIKKDHESHVTAQLEQFKKILSDLDQAKAKNQKLESVLKIDGIFKEALEDEVKELREVLQYDQMFTHMFTSNVYKEKLDENETSEKVNKQELTQEASLKVRLDELFTMEQEIEKEHEAVDKELTEMHKNLTQIAIAATMTSRAVQTEFAWVKVEIDPEAINLIPVNPASYYCLIKAAEGSVVQQIKPRANDGVKWSLTPTILKFLTDYPIRKSNPYPYSYFKKLLNEFCLERLSINPEICGYMQPPLPLDEFICLFFLKRNHLKRLSQVKVVEFLCSLKSHTKWQRVVMFGKVSGIACDIHDNTDYMYADYYTQMYFIFCIGVLNTNEFLFEDKEGHTWINSDKEESLTLQAMPWVVKNDLRRIRKDISYMTRIVQDNIGNDVECVDEDQLLAYYIKEYISMRQGKLEKLQKNFAKIDQIQKGSYNFDEFKYLISVLDEMMLPDSLILRAFYYSSIANPTIPDINSNSFSAACVRFGIDNPCAFAQVGWDLIFPLPMVRNMVESKEEKYSGLILKKDKAFIERSTFLKVPSKTNTVNRPEGSNGGVSIEKVTGLLAQHYAIIREIKKVSDYVKNIIQQKEGIEVITVAVERLGNVLNSACEFFTFPIVF